MTLADIDAPEPATTMRAFVLPALVSLGFALTASPPEVRAQSDRDFVFTDEEGHLVLRFAGTGATGLSPSQAEEVLNAEFSRMVHDRLRADLLFQQEPRDPDWAASMEPRIEGHVAYAGPEFSNVLVQCRTASCRIIMEQPRHSSVAEHRAALDTVQKSIEAFIEVHDQDFEPVFLITAYDQETETPHIKAFLQRSGQALPTGR